MNHIAYETKKVWQKGVEFYPDHIKLDGIVNESYFSSQEKVLCLLRDLKGFVDTTDDSTAIRIGSIDDLDLKLFSSTETGWKELCCWAMAHKDPETSYLKAEQCSDVLLEIAIVNLRKCVLHKNRFADTDSNYEQMLRQLIRSLNPKLVLCCGTFEQAKKIYKTRSTSNRILMLETGTRCFFADQSLFIDFVHPGVKICKAATYSYAKDVFKEINNFLHSK